MGRNPWNCGSFFFSFILFFFFFFFFFGSSSGMEDVLASQLHNCNLLHQLELADVVLFPYRSIVREMTPVSVNMCHSLVRYLEQ